MIVVVSDVHLGSDVGRKCKRTGRACEDLALDPLFQTFMGYIGKDYLQTKEDRLILLGDIFDFWRKDAAEVLIENQEAISKMKEIARRCVINYVVGNHDYSIREMWRAARTKNLFSTMDKSLHLDIDGDSFTFIHGHQLEVLANPYDKSGKGLRLNIRLTLQHSRSNRNGSKHAVVLHKPRHQRGLHEVDANVRIR